MSKFYFVQDYEPFFFPHGSYYELAKNTYKFGFRGITAGDWIKDKLIADFGMKADSFGFSYDKDMYVPLKKKELLSVYFSMQDRLRQDVILKLDCLLWIYYVRKCRK